MCISIATTIIMVMMMDSAIPLPNSCVCVCAPEILSPDKILRCKTFFYYYC